MPMMRRGPLDRYPVEWVLRQAAAHQTSGSVEFNAPRPITVYLRGGRIHHAVGGVLAAGEAPAPIVTSPDEATARARVVEVLATALGADGGWYYHDPLGRLDDPGPWQWETANLLLEARVRSHEDDTLGAWATSDVTLHLPPSPVPMTLGADAWAVVVALSSPAQAAEVRRRLGWTSERLVTALGDLVAAAALRPDPALAPVTTPDRPRHPDPIADLAAAAAAAESVLAETGASPAPRPSPPAARPSAIPTPTPTSTPRREPAPVGRADPRRAAQLPPTRHVGPLAPPPVLAVAGGGIDDRRSALRRLISSLRPT